MANRNGTVSHFEESHGSGEQTTAVPFADYCLVGWGLDITGRRMLDEICHIAAYVPNNDNFSRYIMPRGNLNIAAKRYHRLQIKSTRFQRQLVDQTQKKVLKTTNAHSATMEFLEWLEKTCNRQSKSGIILIYHENDKFIPSAFINTLEDFNLTDRFSKTVKGFVNCYDFSANKFSDVFVSHDLEILSMVLLDRANADVSKANYRARLAYKIIEHLCSGGSTYVKIGSDSPNAYVIKEILPFVTSVEDERSTLNKLRNRIAKQNRLKPIFRGLLLWSMPTPERQYNAKLRSYLVDAEIEYQTLEELWGQEGKNGIETLFGRKLATVPKRDRVRLSQLIIDHFEDHQM